MLSEYSIEEGPAWGLQNQGRLIVGISVEEQDEARNGQAEISASQDEDGAFILPSIMTHMAQEN